MNAEQYFRHCGVARSSMRTDGATIFFYFAFYLPDKNRINNNSVRKPSTALPMNPIEEALGKYLTGTEASSMRKSAVTIWPITSLSNPKPSEFWLKSKICRASLEDALYPVWCSDKFRPKQVFSSTPSCLFPRLFRLGHFLSIPTQRRQVVEELKKSYSVITRAA